MANTDWERGTFAAPNAGGAPDWEKGVFSTPEPAKSSTLSDLGKSVKAGAQRLPGMVTGLADLPIAPSPRLLMRWARPRDSSRASGPTKRSSPRRMRPGARR